MSSHCSSANSSSSSPSSSSSSSSSSSTIAFCSVPSTSSSLSPPIPPFHATQTLSASSPAVPIRSGPPAPLSTSLLSLSLAAARQPPIISPSPSPSYAPTSFPSSSTPSLTIPPSSSSSLSSTFPPLSTPFRATPFPFKKFNRVNLRFKISYYTQWGQNIMISGSDLLFGKWNVKQGVWMTPHHEGELLIWQAVISVPENFSLDYKYCMVDERLNVIQWESAGSRHLSLPEGLPDGSVVDVLDTWQEGSSPEALLARDAFRKVIFAKPSTTTTATSTTTSGGSSSSSSARLSIKNSSAASEADLPLTPLLPLQPHLFETKDFVVLRFRISCSRLERGQQVGLSGSASVLGRWDHDRIVLLSHTQDSQWEADVAIARDEFPIRYKYVLRDADGTVQPEYGSDIELGLDTSARKPSVMIFVSDGHFRANPWRGAGLAFPVFSIRSRDGLGVGEFSDLRLAVDLAVTTGLRLLQLLPVNDTSVHGTWWDSYPYSSLSVCALHPLYLRIQALSPNLPQAVQEEINTNRPILNSFKEVDYEAVMRLKLRLSRRVFEQERSSLLQSPEFNGFVEENKEWLKPYAAFVFLKSLFGTANHEEWGSLSTFSWQKVERIVSPSTDYYPSICFTYFLQFHLHKQLSEVASYCRQNRVVLKGDLPIGVDRWSVDTWQYPQLFHMDTSTGAPPDDFAENGQNWGFPTYNWEEMAKDNYGWWRGRLNQMAKYFSAYRIDHILGFFRIWELPAHAVSGICGHFRPSIPLSAEEMEQEGLWDFNRLSEPYIRCHILQEKFGSRWAEVASKYLEEYQHLCYRFREEYNTERKVAENVKAREGSPEWLEQEAEETKKGLLSLHQNVVLIRDVDDPRKFYPRFDCEKTSSFAELDDHSKHVIKRLYQDYFYSRQESLWRSNALKTLPVLMNASPMLACGEDLGLVPACVPPVLSELGLLGLRIQRMPVKLGQDFGNPSEYDYMTVCAPSCHDTSTFRAWWEEDSERRHNFFRTVLGYSAPAPDTCTADVTRAVIMQHCDAPSVWAIFPLQDLMALKDEYTKRPAKEETINDPTNPKHYWRFRFHVTMEHLLADSDLIATIQELLLSSGRTSPADLPETFRSSASAFLESNMGHMVLGSSSAFF